MINLDIDAKELSNIIKAWEDSKPPKDRTPAAQKKERDNSLTLRDLTILKACVDIFIATGKAPTQKELYQGRGIDRFVDANNLPKYYMGSRNGGLNSASTLIKAIKKLQVRELVDYRSYCPTAEGIRVAGLFWQSHLENGQKLPFGYTIA
ncbi:MAG: hypothetical protein HC892_00090 [Saprospiraceae bacterium]|nr:hypothetical protein [Saprospiraceae bacterium]